MAQFQEGMVIYGCDVVGTSTGQTAVFTAPQGYVVSQAQVVVTGASGIVLGPSFTIGSNASSYNYINDGTLLTTAAVLNDVLDIGTVSPGYHLQTGDTVYINILTAAVATEYNFQIILLGYPL
jgi:hypothetical protein